MNLSLSTVRPLDRRADDLGAIPIRALIERNTEVDWTEVDDVIYGCANQAGEDNRNVARMSSLLAGLPQGVPGSTVNRPCGDRKSTRLTSVPNAQPVCRLLLAKKTKKYT